MPPIDDAQSHLDELGALIRKSRKAAQLSARETAHRVGHPQSSQSRIENGQRVPRVDIMRRLAAELGMDEATTAHAITLIHRFQATRPMPGPSQPRSAEVEGELRRLGAVIRQRREATGLTQTETGLRAGWGQSKQAKIENGRSLPAPGDVWRLATVLGLTQKIQRDYTRIRRADLTHRHPRKPETGRAQ
ncbi:helix-turn-helix domain-containing protein [Nocardia sp. NRRL S-836]|uniref:helix-turn-helix domain-containing protein n=1 Tax=Nocardia sp. NRRL S-836 TaxID=1519492 RepID=UPI0006AFAF04|nr:helix-turn-helix domain-containing protein [Nocardia sp. NRRL S-836]KOV84682.1 hypothetical protein ADL03_15505 [Nocardia sp. NRRL S-836]